MSRRNLLTSALWLTIFLLALFLSTAAARAQAPNVAVRLDPATTEIRWKLSGFPHSVHGTFKLKAGLVTFDTSTGVAAGEILVDLASGESGNKDRDARMQKEILQSNTYPEAFFHATHVSGTVKPLVLKPGSTQTVTADGAFNIHGADHPLKLEIEVKLAGEQVTATTKFQVPYVAWGMKNPSSALLRVSKTVDVEVVAHGTVQTTAAP